MGSISKESAVNGQFNKSLITLAVSPGTLTTLTCFCTNPFANSCEAYVEIGIIGSLADIMSRTGALISGWTGNHNALSFTGKMPIYVDDYVYASIMSAEPYDFRLVARITPFTQEEKANRALK